MGLFGFPRLPGIPHTLSVTNYSTAHTWFHRSKHQMMTTWPEAHKVLRGHLIHAPKKIKSLKQNVNGTKSSHQIFMPHIQLLHHPIAFKVTCVALLPVIQIGQKLWIHYILLYHSLMNFELHVFMTATNKTTHTLLTSSIKDHVTSSLKTQLWQPLSGTCRQIRQGRTKALPWIN